VADVKVLGVIEMVEKTKGGMAFQGIVPQWAGMGSAGRAGIARHKMPICTSARLIYTENGARTHWMSQRDSLSPPFLSLSIAARRGSPSSAPSNARRAAAVPQRDARPPTTPSTRMPGVSMSYEQVLRSRPATTYAIRAGLMKEKSELDVLSHEMKVSESARSPR
jgi:hypothetical protein